MDTIGDFLTRVRNASMARLEKVDVPASKIRAGIANVLKEEGYIRHFKVARDGKQGMMRVYLKYDERGTPVITEIRRSSRPGRRYYVKQDKIPKVRSGFGLSILTTSKGVMSGRKAEESKIGGEVLCTVW
ncbi:MAG TPA: 30S ribosomal protein S8 [Bdellovibrionales bacterium]|nr:30S ribosomal protein S8 [Bdellovibrionales bacterium]